MKSISQSASSLIVLTDLVQAGGCLDRARAVSFCGGMVWILQWALSPRWWRPTINVISVPGATERISSDYQEVSLRYRFVPGP